MKRIASSLAVILFLAAGCATRHDDGPAIRRVLRTHVIRAAYVESPPSFVVESNGRKTGVMAELMNSVAKSLGLRIVYDQPTSWEKMIELANSGRVDIVVSGIWATRARARRALFSQPLYYSMIFAYARAQDHRFDGDLAAANSDSITILTVRDDLSSSIASAKFPEASTIRLAPRTSASEVLEAIYRRKADLTFLDAWKASAYLVAHPARVKRIPALRPLLILPNAVLFGRREFGLRDLIDTGIDKESDSGAMRAILKRYPAYHDVSLYQGMIPAP